MQCKTCSCRLSKILPVIALAAIIGGLIFVREYPKKVARLNFDAQRLIHVHDLTQALEWYLRSELRERGEDRSAPTP